LDQICRSNGWILGTHAGEVVIGVPQGDGKQQNIEVNEFQDSGQLALRIWSPVTQASKVPSDQALQVNFKLPHGALAEKDGSIVVVATRLWSQTNQADLTHVLQTVAHYAAFYANHYA
jgi:hypothetical protein